MENQKKVKSFSKVLYVIAVLARVCMYFTAVLLVLFAVFFCTDVTFFLKDCPPPKKNKRNNRSEG